MESHKVVIVNAKAIPRFARTISCCEGPRFLLELINRKESFFMSWNFWLSIIGGRRVEAMRNVIED